MMSCYGSDWTLRLCGGVTVLQNGHCMVDQANCFVRIYGRARTDNRTVGGQVRKGDLDQGCRPSNQSWRSTTGTMIKFGVSCNGRSELFLTLQFGYWSDMNRPYPRYRVRLCEASRQADNGKGSALAQRGQT